MPLEEETSELGLRVLRKGAAQLYDVSQGGQGKDAGNPRPSNLLVLVLTEITCPCPCHMKGLFEMALRGAGTERKVQPVVPHPDLLWPSRDPTGQTSQAVGR